MQLEVHESDVCDSDVDQPDVKEIECIGRMLEFIIAEAESLNLGSSVHLLKIAKSSLALEAGEAMTQSEVVEL